MSYTAAVDRLYALGQELAPAAPNAPRRKFDLAHMRILAAALGDPQSRFPSVLIAGTNGKGSTAATLAGILTAAGYRTGLYTSPHLVRVNERIQIDGVPISDENFARLYFQVDEAARRLVHSGDLPHPPSFFEVLTALAFLYYAGHPSAEPSAGPSVTPVDIAILEVGLGGRLDATNIVDPLLSILTDIALDHQDYLGTTLAQITREKAGILRANGTLITLPSTPKPTRPSARPPPPSTFTPSAPPTSSPTFPRAPLANLRLKLSFPAPPLWVPQVSTLRPGFPPRRSLSPATATPPSRSTANPSKSTLPSPVTTSSATSPWPSPPPRNYVTQAVTDQEA